MTGWEKDKEWADNYMVEIKRILGEHLIGAAPVEEDQERNTDLIVLRMNAVRIGVRVRRPEYVDTYGTEFTIRASRPGGAKTELQKIVEGWGDYFFYGFASMAEGLRAWVLADLNVFRLSYHDMVKSGECNWQEKFNRDGSSGFYSFRWSSFPDSLILAAGRNA